MKKKLKIALHIFYFSNRSFKKTKDIKIDFKNKKKEHRTLY